MGSGIREGIRHVDYQRSGGSRLPSGEQQRPHRAASGIGGVAWQLSERASIVAKYQEKKQCDAFFIPQEVLSPGEVSANQR